MSQDAGSDSTVIAKAEALLEQGRFGQAVELLRAAYEESGHDAEIADVFAAVCVHAGALEDAERTYRGRLLSEPRSAQLLNNLGYVLLLADRVEEAILHLERAGELAGPDAEIDANLALAYQKADRPQDALGAIDRALQKAPASPVAWNNRGIILRRLGDTDGAREAFLKALELAPHDASAANNLGCLFRALGRTEDALAAFLRVLPMPDPGGAALRNLAIALAENGRREEAARLCGRIAAEFPGSPYAEDALALVERCKENQP